MKKYSKRFLLLKNLINKKIYSIQNAILLLKKFNTVKFIEKTEIHVNLNRNIAINSFVILPYNINKKLKIAVFDNEIFKEKYINLGAYKVGIENLYDQIQNNILDFDILITLPIYMPKLIKLNNILKIKNLLPSVKNNTITSNIELSLLELQKGKIEYKSDKYSNIHLIFGNILFSEKQLKENLLSVYNSIQQNKFKNIKDNFIKSFSICTTMSPSIKLDINDFKNYIN
jgi:large subunit ribosomal protein L1